MSPPLVSVVTPFYNTADYLAECIESVLKQDWDSFDYVLLDNCSTDGSTEVARRFAEQDPRIHYHANQEHLDQVGNYNAALRLCHPESRYVKVVQADDWLMPNCLREMVRVAEDNPRCRLVLAHYYRGETIGGTALPVGQTHFPGDYVARQQLLADAHYFGTPSTVMYRAEDVRSRRDFYRAGRLHEDTDICYELAAQGDVAFVHQILSGIRTDNPSIRTRTRRYNRYFLDKLIQVVSYGPGFLDETELRPLLRRAKRQYYEGVVGAYRVGDRDFMAYHKRGLQSIGWKMEWGALFLALMRHTWRTLLCPLEAIKRARIRWRGRE